MLLGLGAFGWFIVDIGVGLEMRGLGVSTTKDNQLDVPLVAAIHHVLWKRSWLGDVVGTKQEQSRQ